MVHLEAEDAAMAALEAEYGGGDDYGGGDGDGGVSGHCDRRRRGIWNSDKGDLGWEWDTK